MRGICMVQERGALGPEVVWACHRAVRHAPHALMQRLQRQSDWLTDGTDGASAVFYAVSVHLRLDHRLDRHGVKLAVQRWLVVWLGCVPPATW